MAVTSTPVFPFLSLDRDDLASILYGLVDIVAVHEAVFDEFDSIVDGRLMWWNEAFRTVRTKPVVFRQSLVETYFEPHSAIVHMQNAWKSGKSVQFFEFDSAARDRYSMDDQRAAYIVRWQRVGDFIVEVGNNVSECLAMQEMLADQKSIIATAHRKRALAVERERIARNLHDSVIQHLYATSLSLSAASRNTEQENLELIKKTIDSISTVIEGIRREIFDVESMKVSPLEAQLQDVMVSILAPVNGEFSFSGNTPHVSGDIVPHIRAICTEATSNAVRHGLATKVDVSLDRVGASLVLSISDNGLGTNPDAPLGNGLKNMRERAQSLGGTMNVETNNGKGTRLTWAVPHPGWSS